MEVRHELMAERAVALAEAGRFEDGNADETDSLAEGALDRKSGAKAAGEGAGEGTARAVRVLGFEATTSLSEMLDEVIPWIKDAVADGRI